MSWFVKIARTEMERIKSNIMRLEKLKGVVHDLGYFVIASNSGGYKVLQELLDDNLVQGRPLVYKKLNSALIGENNQKIALDAPTKFHRIILEAEGLIAREIGKEQRDLRELDTELNKT